jgi:hypothetical protein
LLLLMLLLPELLTFLLPELSTPGLPAVLFFAPPVEGVVLGFAAEDGAVAGLEAGAVEGLAALELEGWPAAPDLLGAPFPCARLVAEAGLLAISREQHSSMRSRQDPADDLDCVITMDAPEDRSRRDADAERRAVTRARSGPA